MGRVDPFPTTSLKGRSSHPIHNKPVPHIRREPSSPLKGWSSSHRPLPAPRLLLTPYLGCSAGCEFCFLGEFPGLYRLARDEKVLTVYEGYDEHLESELQRLRIAPPAVLSPFSDPFQPLNERYRLSEKCVKVCAVENLPLEVVTRYRVPEEVVAMLGYCSAARVQISFDPEGEEGDVVPRPARLRHAEWLARHGVNVVPRLSPLRPSLLEDPSRLERLLALLADGPCGHVVVELARFTRAQLGNRGEDPDDWVTSGNGRWSHPRGPLRREVLELARSLCDRHGLRLGVLGNPDGQDLYGHGSSPFPDPLPLMHRRSPEEPFEPVEGCPGDCLRCPEAVCGIEALRGDRSPSRRRTRRDWDRWGRSRLQGELLP